MATTLNSNLSRPIVVVIPALNEAAHIENAIRELSLSPPPEGLRFIVADGGSTDKTRSIALALNEQGFRVEIIDNQRRIQSAGVNLAVSTLDENDLIFVRCDAHATYPSGFVRRIIETMECQDADTVVVPMDSVGNKCIQNAVAWVSNSLIGTGGSRHRGGRQSCWVDHGHHAAFRTNSFVKLNGYDERFVANEDGEFDARMISMGGRIYLDATARIIYYPRDTLYGLSKQYYRYGCGRAQTVLIHPKSLRLRQLLVPAAMSFLAICILISINVPEASIFPAIYTMMLVASSVVIGFRQKSFCALLCGLTAFIMHSSWATGFIRTFLAAVLISNKKSGQADTTSAHDLMNRRVGTDD